MQTLYDKKDMSSKLWTFLNYIFAVLSVLLMVVPILQARMMGNVYTLVMATVMLSWVCTSYFLHTSWFLKLNKVYVLALLILAVYAFFFVLGMGNLRQVAVSIITPWYLFFVFYFYASTERTTLLGSICIWILIAFFITFITTIIGLIDNPASYREFESNTEMIHVNSTKNIGDVNHIYASVLIGSLLVSLLQGKCINSRWVKWLAVLLSIMCFYLAFTCSTGIVVISAFLALALLVIQKCSVTTKLILYMVLIVVFVFFTEVIGNMICELAINIENRYIARKLYDVGIAFIGDGATGTLEARTDRWMADFQVFLESFGMGIGSYYLGASNGYAEVVDHSQLFSDLARYGVFFFVLVASFFGVLWENTTQTIKKLNLNCDFSVIYIIFALMYVVQPVMGNFVLPCVMLLLVPSAPYIVQFINEKTTRKKKCGGRLDV